MQVSKMMSMAQTIGVCAFLALSANFARAADAPVYKVDPFWPKPLPNKWSMQQIVDIYVDKNDHIWVLNRSSDARPDETGASTNPPRTECCVIGPEVLEFDTEGNVLKAWGGPKITCRGGPAGCRRWAWIGKATSGSQAPCRAIASSSSIATASFWGTSGIAGPKFRPSR